MGDIYLAVNGVIFGLIVIPYIIIVFSSVFEAIQKKFKK